jgi:hypothetical protein
LNGTEALDPGPVLSTAVPCQEPARVNVAETPIALQAQADAIRQRLLDFREFVLSGIVLLLGIFLHAFFVFECIVMVVDPHHAIEIASVPGHRQLTFEGAKLAVEKPVEGLADYFVALYDVLANAFKNSTRSIRYLNVERPEVLMELLVD